MFLLDYMSVILSFAVPFFMASSLFHWIDSQVRPDVTLVIYNKIQQNVMCNFFLCHCPFLFILMMFKSMYHDDFSLDDMVLDVIWTIFFSTLVYEVVFYISHRIMHINWFYIRFHKQHHELTHNVVALGALYCHPVEHALTNVLPAVVGVFLLHRPQLFSVCCWTAVAAMSGAYSHNGLVEGNHYSHHAHDRRCEFGMLGVMDTLCGTSWKPKKTRVYPMER